MKSASMYTDPGKGDAWGAVGVKRAVTGAGRQANGDEGDAAEAAAWGGGLPRHRKGGHVESEDDGEFCEGGRPKRKKGGKAEGKMAAHRLDRRPRKAGGHITAAERRELPSSDFGLPGKGIGPGGKGPGSYPLDTEKRARSALSRASHNASSAEQATIRRKVHAKYPDMAIKGAD